MTMTDHILAYIPILDDNIRKGGPGLYLDILRHMKFEKDDPIAAFLNRIYPDYIFWVDGENFLFRQFGMGEWITIPCPPNIKKVTALARQPK